jgi:hypothetical protein
MPRDFLFPPFNKLLAGPLTEAKGEPGGDGTGLPFKLFFPFKRLLLFSKSVPISSAYL